MPTAWRLVKKKRGDSAFSGEGAAKFGGRWNSKGSHVVYTSESKSLAALEILVHLNPRVDYTFLAFPVNFEMHFVECLQLKELSTNWKSEPPGPSTQAMGNAWLKESRTPALQCPSVLVPGEFNYLFNPFHPDYNKLIIGEPEPFAFDPRLLD